MRAFVQSRPHVRSDTPRMSAISIEREAAEKLQIDQLGQLGIDCRQLFERAAEPLQIDRPAVGRRVVILERRERQLPASLQRAAVGT